MTPLHRGNVLLCHTTAFLNQWCLFIPAQLFVLGPGYLLSRRLFLDEISDFDVLGQISQGPFARSTY